MDMSAGNNSTLFGQGNGFYGTGKLGEDVTLC